MANITQEPVSGNEAIVDTREPIAALSQFYKALNRRDLALMEQNWDNSDDAAMDNPLGKHQGLCFRRPWSKLAL